eukprot:CAMPEP_0197575532 /NCGR_PEP_ID=MMETSP1326-20131121/903_1 /TAXON_ID=1155430 /ORGANISM="Genus nov. species nov., Strain RCC2288" /LENGTH=79 /DNA_ID=CAMNT_0043138319 /DNA_START=256 /DNA_END=492 /DNA_ORIENTATION=+
MTATRPAARNKILRLRPLLAWRWSEAWAAEKDVAPPAPDEFSVVWMPSLILDSRRRVPALNPNLPTLPPKFSPLNPALD